MRKAESKFSISTQEKIFEKKNEKKWHFKGSMFDMPE